MSKEITIKLVHTGGLFGDCTDNYDVVTNANTVEEFINAVLGSDNFQTFCLISGSDVSSGEVCMAYATSGEITRKSSNYGSLLSMKLEKIKVNGGWGNMTYSIWVEGELPIQDCQEFQRVYWGYTFT
jgi:hypothetical protein